MDPPSTSFGFIERIVTGNENTFESNRTNNTCGIRRIEADIQFRTIQTLTRQNINNVKHLNTRNYYQL